MSYFTASAPNDAPLYQTPASHNTSEIAALEIACEPYLHAGFKIINHSDCSFVLIRERQPVNLIALILLLLVCAPLGVIYVVSVRNRRDQVVCIRIDSYGSIQVTGDTLTTAEKAGPPQAGKHGGVVVGVLILLSLAGFVMYLFVRERRRPVMPAKAVAPPAAEAIAASSFQPPIMRTPKRRTKTIDTDNGTGAGTAYAGSLTSFESMPLTSKPAPETSSTRTGSININSTAAFVSHKPIAPEPLKLINENEVLFPAQMAAVVYRRNQVNAPAQILDRPEPAFTAEGAQTSGIVQLEAVFRPGGEVTDIRIIKGLPNGLTWSAVKAARHIKFMPANKDGVPVPMLMRLEYSFNAY